MNSNISKFSLYVVLFISFFMSSCGGDEGEELIRVPFQVQFEVPAGLNPALEHRVFITNIQNSFVGLVEQNGIDTSLISAVTAGNGQFLEMNGVMDLNFLLEVEIRIFSNQNPDNSKEIYYRNNIPINTGATLDMFPSLSNIDDIIFEPGMSLEIIFKRLNGPTPASTDVRFTFDLVAIE